MTFDLKYNQMRESDPTRDDAEKDADYDDAGNARNVCFVLLNGYGIALSYAYLVAREYFPEDDRIVLSFTSHIITLTGIRLKALFLAFVQHLPKNILCVEARYNVTQEADKPIVNEISVQLCP